MLTLTTGHASVAASGSPTVISAKTIYVIFRVANNSTTKYIAGLCRGGGLFERGSGLVVTGGNLIFRLATGSYVDTTIAACSTSVWHKALYTQDGSLNDSGYMDSTTPVSLTDVSAGTALDTLGIGISLNDSGVNAYTDPTGTDVAHFYYWSSVLSAGDISSLMGGTNPSSISTGTRVQGYSCISNGNEIGAGTALTVGGTTAFDATDPLASAIKYLRNKTLTLGVGA